MTRTRATVAFDTTQYEFAHGKLPRGEGYWAFENETTGEVVWAPFGLYTDAKKHIRAASPVNDYTVWKVLS